MPNTCIAQRNRVRPRVLFILLVVFLVTLTGCGKVPGISLGGGTKVPGNTTPTTPPTDGGSTTPTTPPTDGGSTTPTTPPTDGGSTTPTTPPTDGGSTTPTTPPTDGGSTTPTTPPTDGGSTTPTTPTLPTSASGLSTREVLVYYTGPEGKIPSSEAVLRQHANKLSYISGFWYQIDPTTYTDLRTMANAPETEIRRTVDLAHSLGVKVEALFHNLLYGGSSTSRTVINKLMADPTLAAKLAENLALLVRKMQFDGINIDIEYVAPESRQAYTKFVKIVADRLHRDGVRVGLSVPAKTWDDPNNGWAGGYDYAALGVLVDRVMLMAYDEHGYSTGDGAIASSDWVRQVVRYAVTQVKGYKLLVGLAGYGFDWASNKSYPVYLDYKQAMAPVEQKLATLQWDAIAHVPKYTYTDSAGVTHKVWFENASSSTWKLDLIKEYGIRGFALWRAGMEDPALWNVVAQKMQAEK